MNVLYYTNKAANALDAIEIVQDLGDNVFLWNDRITLELIRQEDIQFIVSDRSRFLISKNVISHLQTKIINLHPSFLPWNRGYYPNYWSIKEKTPFGVSIHRIDEGIDTGEILAQTQCFYCELDTLRTTYNRLRNQIVGLFRTCWPEIRLNQLPGISQDNEEGSHHLKSEFDGIFKTLPKGWDTKIVDI